LTEPTLSSTGNGLGAAFCLQPAAARQFSSGGFGFAFEFSDCSFGFVSSARFHK
jgi:hypothetical protein